ncbi:hypothetical protein EJ05DRAFT_446392, partial [Pseudovirgaria hyperparasitica]
VNKVSVRPEVSIIIVRGALREYRVAECLYRVSDPPASKIHSRQLELLKGHFSKFKSHTTCFCCLMREPDKVFDCGHSCCNGCIALYGNARKNVRHGYHLKACLLCGASIKTPDFEFMPPTAGPRVLSLDGGGIRGVIPLTFLVGLGRRLKPLELPLRHFFDYVCGTSAGGLITLGIFIMEWTPEDCLQKFEAMAHLTHTTAGKAMMQTEIFIVKTKTKNKKKRRKRKKKKDALRYQHFSGCWP